MTTSSVTIQDVADAAGVSVSTVSRVLNNKDDVAPGTQAKVESVISDLGYSSTLAATSMRRKKTNVIGAVIFDLSDPFSIEVVKGLGQAIRNTEYDIIMYSSGRSPSVVANLERQYVAQLNGSITDGMILVAPANAQVNSKAPLVVIDPMADDGVFPSVMADNQAGTRAAMDYLTGLGHRRIGFIGGRPGLLSAQERLAGYLDGLRHADISVDGSLQADGDFTRAYGRRAAKQLLALPNRPTAIVAANDQSALGVYDAAAAAGLSVPTQLSVVGFDNTREAPAADPPLTTIDQSIGQMAQTAARTLIQLIEGSEPPSHTQRIPIELVIRESCARIE